MRARVLIVVLVVLALRLPFLNQAIQGDDYNYLAGAMHAQTDPLHPTHGRYVFMGQMVDMRGHTHPPFNMWVQAALLAALGDIREVPFHAAYVLFSLIAGLAMLSLAERFGRAPLWATLLFLAVPVFVVNGNSLEADLPLLAAWMASAALYIRAVDTRSGVRLAGAGIVLCLAGLAAFQAVLLAPILAVYLWLNRRGWTAAWAVAALPVLSPAAWQVMERVTGGSLPAGVMAGYFASFGFQQAASKLASATALTVHAGWMIFPALAWVAFGKRLPKWAWGTVIPATAAAAWMADPNPLFWVTFGTGLIVVAGCVQRLADPEERFLAAWALLFFAAALGLFFAGSARYLLPIAAPLAILVANRLAGHPRWLAAGFAANLALGLALAVVNYQHWNYYRAFVDGLKPDIASRRTWVNGEHGLRYYAESAGALPLVEGQAVRPGEMVLTSEIAYPVAFTTGGGTLTPLASEEVETAVPLALIGRGVRSAYSTVTLGFRPFDVAWGPIDTVRAEVVVEREPELSWLPMGSGDADRQIVSGIYQLEGDEGREFRWMAGRALILLKAPPEPRPFEADVYLPDMAPGRRVRATVNGTAVAEEDLPGPGSHRLRSAEPVAVEGETATVEISIDQTFSPPGDRRELGLILAGAGFR